MVTVVHVYNRFHSSEIRCFVNGKVVSTGETTLVHANEVDQPRKNDLKLLHCSESFSVAGWRGPGLEIQRNCRFKFCSDH